MDSYPFLVTNALPFTAITSPLRIYTYLSLFIATCNFLCYSRISRKVVLPCCRIEDIRPIICYFCGGGEECGDGVDWCFRWEYFYMNADIDIDGLMCGY